MPTGHPAERGQPIAQVTAAQTRDEIRILVRSGATTRRRLLTEAFAFAGLCGVGSVRRAQDAIRALAADDAKRTPELESLLDRLARLEQTKTA